MYALFGSPSLAAVKEELKCDGGWSRTCRNLPLERSAEHRISPINNARNVGAYLWLWHLHRRSRRAQVHRKAGAKHQKSDGYEFKCGYSLGLGSLHRIQVDAARADFKLSRGHNGALAMLAPWHASSNIDSAFRLRRHVDHDMGRRSQRG